uniref:Uncharacterized protein n=1 Tax=Anguilla anguilla TaxID=7936 RepID=A0A0E9QD20_ANGAN
MGRKTPKSWREKTTQWEEISRGTWL